MYLQVIKPLNQVLSSLVDQEAGHQIEHDNFSSDGTYTVEEFEVRILEPEKSGGPWQIRGTIPMQSSENALTVRVVTLFVSLTVIITIFFFFTLLHQPSFFEQICGNIDENRNVMRISTTILNMFTVSYCLYNRIQQLEKMKHFWLLGLPMYKGKTLLDEGVYSCFL